jgi:hypothetical protein
MRMSLGSLSNGALTFERTENVESKKSGEYEIQIPKLKHMTKVRNVNKDRIWK